MKKLFFTLLKTESSRIIPHHFKLIAVLVIFLLSLYSGINGASESSIRKAVFVRQTQASGLSNEGIEPLKLDEKPVVQVSSIAIISKKTEQKTNSESPKSPDTKTPTKEVTESKDTHKEENNTPDNSLLSALNEYRKRNGKSLLSWDNKLADYAQSRAELYDSSGSLDGHAGFNDFIKNHDGFKKLGFSALGENSGYGHNLDSNLLIEQVYGNSSLHNENQLNSLWSHVGIGIKGSATNFVFGGNKQ